MWPFVGPVVLGSLIIGQAGRGGKYRPGYGPTGPTPRAPRVPVSAVQSMCVTKGAILQGGRVEAPTFRAVAVGTSGQAAAVVFAYDGSSRGTRALGSGQIRRQIGLKLRAENGCNLVYVMWRLDPSPQIEVSVKINPGARTHAECATRGYSKVTPDYRGPLAALNPGEQHWMQAEIVGDELVVWTDGQVAWQGRLPPQARQMSGPSGVRSDNVGYRILGFYAPAGASGAAIPRCVLDGED